MRLVLSALCAATLLSAVPAEAQYRRPGGLAVTVQKRSFLDAGKVVPVGRYSNYVTVGTYSTPPAFGHIGEFYGESTLPARGMGRPLFTFASPY